MERLVIPVDIKMEKRAKIRAQKYFIYNPFCDSLNSVIMKLLIHCIFLTHALPKCSRKLGEICWLFCIYMWTFPPVSYPQIHQRSISIPLFQWVFPDFTSPQCYDSSEGLNFLWYIVYLVHAGCLELCMTLYVHKHPLSNELWATWWQMMLIIFLHIPLMLIILFCPL